MHPSFRLSVSFCVLNVLNVLHIKRRVASVAVAWIVLSALSLQSQRDLSSLRPVDDFSVCFSRRFAFWRPDTCVSGLSPHLIAHAHEFNFAFF